jgi:membrane protein DedA with SNARE-associated domain
MELLALFSLDQVERWFEWGGYFILFGLLFACGLGLPLPEDVPLLLGGYFVALGQMHLVWVALLAWLGIIGGDCCLYWLSRKYGMNITKVRFIGSHVTESRILWAEKKFDEYGVWVVAVCRLFAGVRGAMVIAAGVVRFNFIKFVIADGIAALFSGGLFVYLGWLAGKKLGSVADMRRKIEHYEHYVVVGLVGAVVLFAVYLWWRRKKHTTLSEKTFEKIIDPAVEKLEHRHEQDGPAAPPVPPVSPAPPTPGQANRPSREAKLGG